MTTYTYVSQRGNFILSRGYNEDGSRFDRKDEFSPSLFVESPSKNNNKSEWVDIHGNKLYEVNPGSINDCREFIERYKDVGGFKIHGMTNWATQYVAKEYNRDLEANLEYTRVYYIDIETEVELGVFPSPERAEEKILLITNYDSITDRYLVYSSKQAKLEEKKELLNSRGVHPQKISIFCFADEYSMLKQFVIDWANSYPDVVTGWNTETFDIPYLVRRIDRVLGESFSARLSPWGKVRERYINKNNEKVLTYDIDGINCLDYLALMKKFTYGERSSWKLGDVAEDELGESKLEFEGTFKEQYTNEYNTFVVYNVIDVHLIILLEKKLKLIELALAVAYMAKINPDEVFSPIRTWDSIIYNYLLKKKVVVPPQKHHKIENSIAGGYVKDPQIGKHMYVVSVDLQSLYPHLMMWGNMSPDTIVPGPNVPVTVDMLLSKSFDTSEFKRSETSLAANGHSFYKDKEGFLPALMNHFYAVRSSVKKQMLKYEQEYADSKNQSLLGVISGLNAKQMAVKILINAAYGATASPYFRYFDNRIAEAITLSGQLAIQWVSNDINKFLNKICETKKNIDYIIANDTDSVVGDTVITVNGKQTTIADYFDQCSGYMIKNDEFNKNFVKSVSGDITPSVNEFRMVENKPILYVMKHRVKKRLYRIEDNYGNSVTVTEDHSVIVVNENGYTESVKPADMNIFDQLITKTADGAITSEYHLTDLGIVETDVYDIEVEDNHNFFGNNICVHNSAYVNMAPVVEKFYANKSVDETVAWLDKFFAEVMQKVIDKSYEELKDYMNAYDQKLIMKREAISSASIFCAKKRYAMIVHNSEGVQYKEPKIKVVGLEMVRSSTPQVVREILKDGIKQVLNGTESSVQKFISDYRNKYSSFSVNEIAFPRGVNGMKIYSGSPIYHKGAPIHVRASLLYNHYITKLGLESKYDLINEGNKMKFVYLKLPNPFKENVIGFVDKLPPEFGLEKYLDYDTMFEKSFEGAMETLIKPLGWKTQQTASLEDLFG